MQNIFYVKINGFNFASKVIYYLFSYTIVEEPCFSPI